MDQINHSSSGLKQQQSLKQQKSLISPNVELTQQQKVMLNQIVQNMQGKMVLDITKPEVKRLLVHEFQLQGQEIKGLESQIQQYFFDIVLSHSNQNSPLRRQENINKSKSIGQLPNINGIQSQEIEQFQKVDYSQYPIAPCVQSIYYISKIAQNQKINIYVSPTILVMQNEETKLLYNDTNDGHLIVDSKKISEQQVIQFIRKQMTSIFDSYSIEDKLIVPKFIIRIAQNMSRKNDCKIYFSQDAMVADMLSYWGNCDMAVQLYIKQKCQRPKYYRYFMKGSNIYKSVQISNRQNLDKDSLIYKTMQQLIESQQIKSSQNSSHQHNEYALHDHKGGNQRNSIINQRSMGNSATKQISQSRKNELEDLFQDDNGKDIGKSLNIKKLPKTMQAFKLTAYDNELQVIIPNKKLQKIYLCTSNNMKNLKVNQFRPSAFPLAERMTQDLYRLFNQYYLKTQKFGHISRFICDFIEGDNGMVYLSQVKCFECEGIKYDWQQQWQPSITKALNSPLNTQKNILGDYKMQIEQCQAKIICQHEELNLKFIEALQDMEMWKVNTKKNYLLPKVQQKQVLRYKAEVDYQRSEWREFKEKLIVCPLVPLITFKDMKKEYLSSPGHRRRHTRSISGQLRNEDITPSTKSFNIQTSLNSVKSSAIENGKEKEDKHDIELQSCVACFKIIQLYQQRYQALTFKSDEVVNELKYLKLCFKDQWTKENIQFMLKQYKSSKLYQYKVPALEKLQKLKIKNEILQRSQTPDSVTRRQSQMQTQRLNLESIQEQETDNQKQLLKQKQQQLLQKQQDSIAKLQQQRQNRLQAQSENTRNYSFNQTPRESYQKHSQQKLGEKKQSHQQDGLLKGYFLRDSSTFKSTQNATTDKSRNDMIQSKSHKNFLKPINAKTTRDHLSTIEVIYKDLPPQKTFYKIKDSMKSSINKNELSKLINNFGLQIGQTQVQNQNTNNSQNQSNAKLNDISAEKHQLPQKHQQKSFFRSFLLASQNNKNTLKDNSNNTHSLTTTSVSPNPGSTISFINSQRGGGYNFNNDNSNLINNTSQYTADFLMRRKKSHQRSVLQLQQQILLSSENNGSKTNRIVNKDHSDYRMYFNNKKVISNAKANQLNDKNTTGNAQPLQNNQVITDQPHNETDKIIQ